MDISRKRRLFLKSSLTAGSIGLAVSAGLITPSAVMAAWPKQAFNAEKTEDAIKKLYGADATASDKISIKAPEVAENGAVVPVTVKTDLPDVSSIAIMSSKNARPLTSSYDFLDNSVSAFVSTRIKVGKSGDLIAVVKAGDKVYTAKTSVKVTMGGCGG